MHRSHLTPPLIALGVAAVWAAAVVAVARVDGFAVEPGTPPWPILLAVAGPLIAFALLWRRVSGVRQRILDLDPMLVLAVQLWRVVGAAFLFGWAGGELEAEFAIPAGVGDIATGVAALLVLGALRQGTLRRSHLIGFTMLGVGDFAVAVVGGAIVGPDGLEALPWVLFPALAVPFFLVVHVVNYLQLAPIARDSRSAAPSSRDDQALTCTAVPLGSSAGRYSAMCMGTRTQPWLAG